MFQAILSSLGLMSAGRSGVFAATPLLGRPSRMGVPAALSSVLAMSTGCVGNRFYTGLKEGQLYAVLRGSVTVAVAGSLPAIQRANASLSEYYHDHSQAFRNEVR